MNLAMASRLASIGNNKDRLMTKHKRFSFWCRVGVGLALGVALVYAEVAWASRRYYRHYHRQDYHHSRAFLGFQYFGYPYGFYADPYAYNSYAPGEHRRFPDFRLPAFFGYPGALGKGEALEQTSERPDGQAQDARGETQRGDVKSGR
jgi:hypothetical protein